VILINSKAKKNTKLAEKIKDKTAKIGIVGLGYTGLPLAVEFAKAGYTVTGIDINNDRVDGVKSGISYLEDVDDAVIRAFVKSGRLAATTNFDVIKDLDIINVCVPTPLTKSRQPDLAFVRAASQSIADYLTPEKLIILESTTYPGTTREVVKPILEAGGLRAGADFYLAYSPERVDPGNKKYNIKNTPKIVGGLTPACLEHITLLYEQVVDNVVSVTTPEAAELAKLLENIFRNVNIALVNEMTLICNRLGINVWEVINAASTKPFGFMRFLPGPGLGGHCIPVDPFYLSWKAREHSFFTEFIELAGKINENMPYYVIQRITDALNGDRKSLNGSKVLLLGVAYKRDISDIRESPAFKIIELLRAKGAEVSYHDSFVPIMPGMDLESQPLTAELLAEIDAVVVVTDHSNIDYELVLKAAPLIVDTRNALAEYKSDKVVVI